ncbi:MAG: hypothetical protein ACO3B3_06900 [Cyanobium sp.]
MARPRWYARSSPVGSRLGRHWDRFVALWAALNLLLVIFDITYLPLRSFWLQRNLYPIPSVPLALPLRALPDITPWVDPIKGIEPHRETSAYLRLFDQLDAAMAQGGGGAATPTAAQQLLLRRQVEATVQLIDTNPFEASGATSTLEKIKGRLQRRADRDSAKQAAALLLSPAWLSRHPWSEETRFWRTQVLPLVATNYWRSFDQNGRPTDHVWRYDLLLFQSVFALDILLRAVRMRRRLPGLRWREALLRRWIDLPLLLPFWRILRLGPVLERLQTSGLISIEPLRAVVSRGVVALLAIELFEVLALQLLDGLQQLVRSRRWPQRLRSLRSHQTVTSHQQRELVELMRIWAPLLLARVAPRLAPELEGVLGHALQQSLQSTMVPPPLRQLQPLLGVEKGISRQLAAGVVDSLLDLTRSTGNRLGRRDDEQLELLQRVVDRFWEELASALESGPALQSSQDLLCALIEQVKRTYLGQLSRAGVGGLIEELDQLMIGQPLGSQERGLGSGGGWNGPPVSGAAAEETGAPTPPAGTP